MKSLVAGLGLMAGLATGSAFAEHGYYAAGGYVEYPTPVYPTPPPVYVAPQPVYPAYPPPPPPREFAQVVGVQPIYTQVQVNQPRSQCYDQPVTYSEPPHYSGDNTAGAVIGAVIGGVVGNQFGRGTGRALATGAGVAVGATVGSHAGEGYSPGYTQSGYQRQCQTVNDVHYENHLQGYDVAYRYHGGIYHTTMPYDPGDRIAVDAVAHPVRY